MIPTRVVGAVLVLAAVMKADSPHALLEFLRYVGFGGGHSGALVLGIVAVEAGIGVALVVDPHWKLLRRSAIVFVCGFLVVPILRWLQPAAPGCGCLGVLEARANLESPLWEFGRGMVLCGLLLVSTSERKGPDGTPRIADALCATRSGVH